MAIIRGTSGNDTGSKALNGTAGNDQIFGYAGADKLLGNGGNDVLEGGAGGDELVGGTGFDVASYASSTGEVYVSLRQSIASKGDAQGDRLAGIEGLIGSAWADYLEGNDLANRLEGRAGTDLLLGHNGDDVLAGGADGDQLFGGSGFDLASYAGSIAGVNVSLLNFTASGGDAQGDALYNIEGLIGSALGDSLTGDDYANRLEGGAGGDGLNGLGAADRIYGGGGGDFIVGGEGDDHLFGGDGNDQLLSGTGADEIRGDAGRDLVNYVLSAEGIILSLKDGTGQYGDAAGDRLVGIEDVVGSAYGDVIRGNGAANEIRAYAGNDILTGYEGNDQLLGQAGADLLQGGAGADRFAFERASDSDLLAFDQIADFRRSDGDKIVYGFDANLLVSGEQAFSFIGEAEFTGAGQLRFYEGQGGRYVAGNLDADTTAPEFVIGFNQLITFQASDFIRDPGILD